MKIDNLPFLFIENYADDFIEIIQNKIIFNVETSATSKSSSALLVWNSFDYIKIPTFPYHHILASQISVCIHNQSLERTSSSQIIIALLAKIRIKDI